MDPFSLIVGIGTLIQETYLLVNYVYKTVNLAKDSDKEREDVAASMRWELLMLESFGRWFVKANGVLTNDPMLDQVRYIFDDTPSLNFKADVMNHSALAARNILYTKEVEKRFRRFH